MGCRSTVYNRHLTEDEAEQSLERLTELGYLERTVVDGEPRYKPTEAGRRRYEEIGPYDPDEHQRRREAVNERIIEAMTEDEKTVLRWMADNDAEGFVLKEDVAEGTGLSEADAEDAIIGLFAFGLIDEIRHY